MSSKKGPWGDPISRSERQVVIPADSPLGRLAMKRNIGKAFHSETYEKRSAELLEAQDEMLKVKRMINLSETMLLEIFEKVANGEDIDRMKYGLTPEELEGIVADAQAALQGEVHVDIIARN